MEVLQAGVQDQVQCLAVFRVGNDQLGVGSRGLADLLGGPLQQFRHDPVVPAADPESGEVPIGPQDVVDRGPIAGPGDKQVGPIALGDGLLHCLPRLMHRSVTRVGLGEKALVYRARYLDRETLSEPKIQRCDDIQVTLFHACSRNSSRRSMRSTRSAR